MCVASNSDQGRSDLMSHRGLATMTMGTLTPFPLRAWSSGRGWGSLLSSSPLPLPCVVVTITVPLQSW